MSQPREYLSEDILDENFVKCFEPIHVVQTVLGSSRVDVRYYFVTPTSLCQKLYTCLFFVFVTISGFYYQLFYYEAYFNTNVIIYFGSSFGLSLQLFTYLINVIQIRFFKGEQSVKLYLMLQKIDRSLKLKNLKSMNRSQYLFNLTIVVLLGFVFFTGYIVHVLCCVGFPILTSFIGLAIFAIHVELLLPGSLIYYLTVRLRFLNEVIKYNVIMKKENQIPGDHHMWVLKEEYKIISSGTEPLGDSLGLKKFMSSLKSIMSAYKAISELFKFQVFTIAAVVFIWSLLVIQSMTIGVRTQVLPVECVVTLGAWIALYFTQLVGLVILCDKFDKQVKALKSLGVYVLSIYYEGPIFKAAKDIVEVIEFEKPIFRVYGIFVLDKTFPLKMIGLITSNVVMLLQFTL